MSIIYRGRIYERKALIISAGALVLLSLIIIGKRYINTTELKFNMYMWEWHRQCKSREMQKYSDTSIYVELPAYRAIVKIGPPVLPYIKKRLEQSDSLDDDMLVYAVIEICGWKVEEFTESKGLSVGYVRRVLDKMKAEKVGF
jgi:hypothetical protein